jgi:hypothetical protein
VDEKSKGNRSSWNMRARVATRVKDCDREATVKLVKRIHKSKPLGGRNRGIKHASQYNKLMRGEQLAEMGLGRGLLAVGRPFSVWCRAIIFRVGDHVHKCCLGKEVRTMYYGTSEYSRN